MMKLPDGSLHKHIRVSRALWERIERASEGNPLSPSQVLADTRIRRPVSRTSGDGQ